MYFTSLCNGKCSANNSDIVFLNIPVCGVFRLYVCNFWSQERRLPTATLERMQMVLGSLYSCQIERCFLSLATNLLLEMTSQSPDFTRNMFEYPLSECTFQVSTTCFLGKIKKNNLKIKLMRVHIFFLFPGLCD